MPKPQIILLNAFLAIVLTIR